MHFIILLYDTCMDNNRDNLEGRKCLQREFTDAVDRRNFVLTIKFANIIIFMWCTKNNNKTTRTH